MRWALPYPATKLNFPHSGAGCAPQGSLLAFTCLQPHSRVAWLPLAPGMKGLRAQGPPGGHLVKEDSHLLQPTSGPGPGPREPEKAQDSDTRQPGHYWGLPFRTMGDLGA